MLTRRAAGAAPVAAMLFAALACGDQLEPDPAEVASRGPESSSPAEVADFPEHVYPPANVSERVAASTSDWPYLYANSLERMVQESDTIVVGRSVEVNVGYPWAGFIQAHFGQSGGETPPPGDPKAASSDTPDPSGKVGPVGSWYTVEVLQVLRGAVSPGAFITINQNGGVIDGIMYEDEDDPLIRVPATYLFFLHNPKPDTFGGSPFGGFEFDTSGRLRPVNAESWGWLPTISELDGLTVDAAVGRITAVIAGATGIYRSSLGAHHACFQLPRASGIARCAHKSDHRR